MSGPITSVLFSLITSVPLFVVWGTGIILAHLRWRRHPRVSACLLSGLYAMLVLNVGQRFVSFLILDSSRRSGRLDETTVLYLGVLALVASFVRTGAWIAILVALFGWRRVPEGTRDSPFQFSIASLMGLTVAVAVLCGLARWLVVWLGESAGVLLQLLDDIPYFVCLIVGLSMAIWRWNRHPRVSRLAVPGIGIQMAIIFSWQIAWIVVATTQSPAWVASLSGFLLFFSAAGWALVIAAVLRGREPAA